MRTTFDRETFARSGTAELARQIDEILDHRYQPEPPVVPEPARIAPISIVRALFRRQST